MPRRLEPFLNNAYYHIFTRTFDSKIIFRDKFYLRLFLNTLKYYRSAKTKLSFSYLSRLPKEELTRVLKEVSYLKYFRIEILAYCLMPTHFHLLLKQKKEKGIQKYISDVLNSFTRYFNIRNQRKGPIFLPKFKSSYIPSDEILLHVSRYIHLNPYSSGVVSDLTSLEKYPWSSFPYYLRNDLVGDYSSNLISNKEILEFFDSDKRKYRKFVLGNAEYQKTLEAVKYAEKW